MLIHPSLAVQHCPQQQPRQLAQHTHLPAVAAHLPLQPHSRLTPGLKTSRPLVHWAADLAALLVLLTLTGVSLAFLVLDLRSGVLVSALLYPREVLQL